MNAIKSYRLTQREKIGLLVLAVVVALAAWSFLIYQKAYQDAVRSSVDESVMRVTAGKQIVLYNSDPELLRGSKDVYRGICNILYWRNGGVRVHGYDLFYYITATESSVSPAFERAVRTDSEGDIYLEYLDLEVKTVSCSHLIFDSPS